MAMPQSLGPLGGPASDSEQNQNMGDHNEMVVGVCRHSALGAPDTEEAGCHQKQVGFYSASTRTAEPTRANAPAVVVVQALETMSVRGSTWVHCYAAAHFRFLIGASGRYDDGQHTRPDTFHQTTECLEYRAWQAKTMSVIRERSKVLPLFCPKRAFSTESWWVPLHRQPPVSLGITTQQRPPATQARTRIPDVPVPTMPKESGSVMAACAVTGSRPESSAIPCGHTS
eukprot:1891769-Amphidinium_carterae.1